MAKKQEKAEKIPVKDLEVGATYRTYVLDLVKILQIDEDRETVVLYNISGAHKQWVSFKNIFLIEKTHG